MTGGSSSLFCVSFAAEIPGHAEQVGITGQVLESPSPQVQHGQETHHSLTRRLQFRLPSLTQRASFELLYGTVFVI